MLPGDPDAPPELQEIGSFDTHPESDAAGFEGSWSVYPFLPLADACGERSLVVSGIFLHCQMFSIGRSAYWTYPFGEAALLFRGGPRC